MLGWGSEPPSHFQSPHPPRSYRSFKRRRVNLNGRANTPCHAPGAAQCLEKSTDKVELQLPRTSQPTGEQQLQPWQEWGALKYLIGPSGKGWRLANPFHASTISDFSVARCATSRLAIFDLLEAPLTTRSLDFRIWLGVCRLVQTSHSSRPLVR
ncbi:hypothetical protein LZ30DRAFT_258802 [Colletotrichum cereale]|nr:hypothetical protein LZ30DRAFT_258802 [Colletotrichum cereale]